MNTTTLTMPRLRGRIGLTLIMSFVLLSIVPVVVLVTLALNEAEQQVRELAFDQMQAQAEVKVNDIRRWLDSSSTLLVVVQSNSDQAERMATILASDRPLTTAVMLQTEFFQEQLAAQDIFSEYFLFNREGAVRVSTDESRIGADVRDQPYFSTGLNGATIQFPFFERESDSIQMMAMQPVASETGEIVGVLAGRLRLDVLSTVMTTRVGLGETGETYLIMEADNRLVTASRFDGYPVAGTYSSPGIDTALGGESGLGTYASYRGVPVIGVYRWLPDLQAAMLAEIEEAEALALVQQARRTSIGITALALVVALVLGGVVTLWLTRPITRLTNVATQVIAGDYSQRTPVTRSNEIGQLTHAFNSMTDTLVNTISNLDQRVQELGIANERAREAARLKDEFLAVMSHELRTPLNASIGLLGLLKMGGRLDPDDAEMVQRARANNERLLALINNILDLSRFEAGRMEINPTEVRLHRLVGKLQAEMEVLAQQKNLEFETIIDPNLPEIVYLDVDGITKILTNLLSNAFKFTETGAVRLALVRRDTTLVITVSDTGIGIPAHLQETIFESFRQADASSKRVYGGTGLGLSIVQRLSKAMGGSVRVESSVGSGSTFTVELPLQVEAVAER